MSQPIMTQDVLTEIEKEVRKIVPDLEGQIDLECSFEDLGLDSLDQIDVLGAIEQTYGVEIPDSELPNIATVQGLVSLILQLSNHI